MSVSIISYHLPPLPLCTSFHFDCKPEGRTWASLFSFVPHHHTSPGIGMQESKNDINITPVIQRGSSIHMKEVVCMSIAFKWLALKPLGGGAPEGPWTLEASGEQPGSAFIRIRKLKKLLSTCGTPHTRSHEDHVFLLIILKLVFHEVNFPPFFSFNCLSILKTVFWMFIHIKQVEREYPPTQRRHHVVCPSVLPQVKQ